MKKLLILPLFLLAVLLGAADRKVNAALIALNKQAEMFCDLLLGVYGETLPVTFLERNSRTALEQEFRLNQTGLLSGDWQPSERHLEKAELFFVAESGEKTTRILIFDGRRGIRLVDCDLVRKDALISAASGAELLKLALKKTAGSSNRPDAETGIHALASGAFVGGKRTCRTRVPDPS